MLRLTHDETALASESLYRSMTVVTIASLSAKYWYSEPGLTPAAFAIRVVEARRGSRTR